MQVVCIRLDVDGDGETGLEFRCTCGRWASTGFCRHVLAVMSKHPEVPGVADDLVETVLRPMAMKETGGRRMMSL